MNMKKSLKKYTYPFFETIRIQDGRVQLLQLHQRRVNHVFKSFYPGYRPLILHEHIPDTSAFDHPVLRWRVAYNGDQYSQHISMYAERRIAQWKPVEAQITYPFKFSDRSSFDGLKEGMAEEAEPLITTLGRVREATFANVILRFGEQWLTPMYPIFHGVMRTHLLSQGKIETADLFVEDFHACDEVRLINAMLPM